MASTMTSGDINLFMSGASHHAQTTADQHEHELSVAIIGAKIWKPLSEETCLSVNGRWIALFLFWKCLSKAFLLQRSPSAS